jgi:tetratricopeptide (TPR) repeat protein
MSTTMPSLHRFRDSGGDDSRVRIEAARIAARRGNHQEARQLLRQVAQADPQCAEVWLGLAWLATTAAERRALLHRALAVDPNNHRAKAEMARLQPSVPQAAATAATALPLPGRARAAAPSPAEVTPERVAPPVSRTGRRVGVWLLGLAVVAGVLLLVVLLAWGPVSRSVASLLATPVPTAVPTPTPSPAQIAGQFVPQLESALAGEEWARSLELVGIMQSLAPSDPGVSEWSRKAHMQVGQALVRDGQAGDALAHFDLALTIAPADAEASLWLTTTQAYLSGQEALGAVDWEGAIGSFTLVQGQIPGYGDASARLLEAYRGLAQEAMAAKDWSRAIEALTSARELAPGSSGFVDSLELAYRERGIAREESGAFPEARTDLEAALALAPGDAKAKTHLDQVMYKMFPPKRIEIDISEQRMYVYQGDKLLHKWVISTGLPGRDTATGHFKVLDKIPRAYSNVWHLTMPYWLGIYYVGGIENGIHALPIRPDGSVMWAGLLGQKASYGCVILDNGAAPILYDWAEVGTKVDIRY